MAVIPDVSDREVVIGGGVHAAIYCATRVALGFDKPLVLEKETTTGGVFARYLPFWLNSANRASLRSVRPGPTRLLPESRSDELNWLPNCEIQISDISRTEYPSSADVALAVQRNLRKYAEVITGVTAGLSYTTTTTPFFTTGGKNYFPRRLIDARGIQMRDKYQAAPVITAEALLSNRARIVSAPKVAVIGGQDTGSIVIEYMLGMGTVAPTFDVNSITWFGENLPETKALWMTERHARYLGLARHFPQGGQSGMIRPVRSRADVMGIGGACTVDGEVFDLAILCTGFSSAAITQSSADPRDYGEFMRVRRICDNFFAIGAVTTPLAFSFREKTLGFDRFAQNSAAIFRLGRRTAALAAGLPR